MLPEIRTMAGRLFNFTEPEKHEFSIYEITHALSNLCRFTGHTTAFYSVAQHSVLVSGIVPPHLALKALLHDAAEAYLGDVSAPLKQLLPEYKAIETRVEAALLRHFGLDPSHDPIIKHADMRALATELRDLMPGKNAVDVEPLAFHIRPLAPHEAAFTFLDRYEELTRPPGRRARDLSESSK
jgi:hypothetical protein